VKAQFAKAFELVLSRTATPESAAAGNFKQQQQIDADAKAAGDEPMPPAAP
jgi:hypothetical protein